ncbi:replication-associated recombination protein A [bacterium]|nr:replication-associated recombination protein A [candidate division CSSED10-310 bacterium]
MPLFDDLSFKNSQLSGNTHPPLADRMRPRTIAEVVGQDHLLSPGRALHRIIVKGIPVSLIFWGPPGSGKTTLARLISSEMNAVFIEYSAVLSGVKQIREVIIFAEKSRRINGKQTILFIDEIHRFNKIQQDAFLPHVENGTITLIGATTENPSFEVIPALLSRCRIFTLKALDIDSLKHLLTRALQDESLGIGDGKLQIDSSAMDTVTAHSCGDARVALNTLEFAANLCLSDESGDNRINLSHAHEALQTRPALYDKSGEQHFNLISAFQKSIRGSDPQGALYWMARMLDGGEDPLYIVRRMIRIASEDVGLADPQALPLILAAREAYSILGYPEGELALAEAAVYLATAPKSNSLESAMNSALESARKTNHLPVPLHLRNAPTGFLKAEGYGRDYIYDHEMPGAFSGQDYLPEELTGQEFYHPKRLGFEREIGRRMDWWRKRKQEINKKVDNPETA